MPAFMTEYPRKPVWLLPDATLSLFLVAERIGMRELVA